MDSVLSLLLNLLFVALWCCLGFFALRFIAGRYFHEPRRADIAAFGVVLAFAFGALWPFSSRLGLAPDANIVAAAAPAQPIAAPPRILAARNVSSGCGNIRRPLFGGGFGAVDTLVTRSNRLITNGSRLSFGRPYRLQGWAADDVSHDGPALAVCLVVDGHVVRGAKSMYGAARPDVVAALHRPGLLPTAYSVTIESDLLARGDHELQVATLSQNGVFNIVAGTWNVTVR